MGLVYGGEFEPKQHRCRSSIPRYNGLELNAVWQCPVCNRLWVYRNIEGYAGWKPLRWYHFKAIAALREKGLLD